jgi:hypothetical protein
MKKVVICTAALAIMVAIALPVYASDYQGEENRGSLFQVIGDFVTGNYKVDGKPMKEKGMLQIIADQTKQMELSTMDKKTEKTDPAKP